MIKAKILLNTKHGFEPRIEHYLAECFKQVGPDCLAFIAYVDGDQFMNDVEFPDTHILIAREDVETFDLSAESWTSTLYKVPIVIHRDALWPIT